MDGVAQTSGIVTRRNVSLKCVRELGVWVRAREYLTGTGKDAMSDPRLVYFLRDDAKPEGELTALAAVYAFSSASTNGTKSSLLRPRGKEVNTEERCAQVNE